MTEKERLDYFAYDRVIAIYFGLKRTESYLYNMTSGKTYTLMSEPTVCLYECAQSYDNYKFVSFGVNAENKKRGSERNEFFYVDHLRDKIEYLFSIEPNIKKPLQQAKDSFYQKVVIRYFEELMKKIHMKIARDSNRIESARNRYLITYPSYWIIEQAEYLRSMVEIAGIVDKNDHPDRLIMFNESEAIFYRIQEPSELNEGVKEGHKYMICDLSGNKVDMHLYDIKGLINPQNEIKDVSRCKWYIGNIEKPVRPYIGEEDFYPETKLFLSNLFSTSSVNISVEDLKDIVRSGMIEGCQTLKDWWEDTMHGWPTEEDLIKNTPFRYVVPPILQDLYYIKLNTLTVTTEESLPQWIHDGYVNVYPLTFEEQVYKPVCTRVVQYIKNIIGTITDTIDSVIFLSGERRNHSLIKSLVEEYEKTAKINVLRFHGNRGPAFDEIEILMGALHQFWYKILPSDDDKPKLLDYNDSSLNHTLVKNHNVAVLIDYGLNETRVSYIHASSDEINYSKNIEHIIYWPGQTVANYNFPTLNVVLVPKQPFTSLNEDERHNNKCSTNHLHTEYYTFEKDKYGIFLVTHKKSGVKKRIYSNIGGFQFSKTIANSTFSSYQKYNAHDDIVLRKRISFQEFSTLYFQCLTDFLGIYIYSKTGIEKDKYRYCITHDSQQFTEKFILSDSDIKKIALKCEMVPLDDSNSLLILKRSEASAIYCREKIDTNIISDKETHVYFLQMQLYSDRCVLILNSAPLLDKNDKKLWESVHKYAKIKNVAIDIMNIISEELWIYIQRNQRLLLKKCKQHQPQRSFFNSKNMKVFKEMFQTYFTATKTLDLEHSEKSHSIRICDNVQGSCCCVFIKNVDLLEYAIKPGINQLVAIVQSSVSNQTIFQGIKISDMFVMGEFLQCKDLASYKLLEKILLTKLKKINFPKLNNHILQSMIKKTQVIMLNEQEYQQENVNNDIEYGCNSLTQASLNGSVIFSIDPRNRLVERLAVKTYFIYLSDHLSSRFQDSFQTIILKGTPIKSVSSIEDEIIKAFSFQKFDEMNLVGIDLLVLEDDDASYLYDKSIDEKHWYEKYKNSIFELLSYYRIEPKLIGNQSYPIVCKTHISQDSLFKFWIEYGKNEKHETTFIHEPFLLKSCHSIT